MNNDRDLANEVNVTDNFFNVTPLMVIVLKKKYYFFRTVVKNFLSLAFIL
jgi:hypothetical protein